MRVFELIPKSLGLNPPDALSPTRKPLQNLTRISRIICRGSNVDLLWLP